jgi:subtilisin family serine protease
MTRLSLSLSALAGRTGRGVRIAVIDSGVHSAHPHVGRIIAAAAFDDDGGAVEDAVDRLGHGTAVAAAIHEKAPDADLLAVKVFDRSLASTGRALEAAIGWAAAQRVTLINLSLGTTNPGHRGALERAVRLAAEACAIVIAAAPDADHEWLPGALTGVVSVALDWDCARDTCDVSVADDASIRIRASGYPRPIPGVSPERNLKGQSFAVANATGLMALAIEGTSLRSIAELAVELDRWEIDGRAN